MSDLPPSYPVRHRLHGSAPIERVPQEPVDFFQRGNLRVVTLHGLCLAQPMDTRYPFFVCMGCATFSAGMVVEPTSMAGRVAFTSFVALIWFIAGYRSKRAEGS